jgi:hypothetical protein
MQSPRGERRTPDQLLVEMYRKQKEVERKRIAARLDAWVCSVAFTVLLVATYVLAGSSCPSFLPSESIRRFISSDNVVNVTKPVNVSSRCRARLTSQSSGWDEVIMSLFSSSRMFAPVCGWLIVAGTEAVRL